MTLERYLICTPIAILLCGLAVPSQSQLRFESGNFSTNTNVSAQPLLLAMTQSPHRAPSVEPLEKVEKTIEKKLKQPEVKPIKKPIFDKPLVKKTKPEKTKPVKKETVKSAEVTKAKAVKTNKPETDKKPVDNPVTQDLAAGVTQQAVVIEKPTFLTKPKAPSYPRVARKRGFEGTALIEVQFNRLGEQISQQVVKSTGFSVLDLAAIEAVEQWQFAVPNELSAGLFTVRVPVKFSLNHG